METDSRSLLDLATLGKLGLLFLAGGAGTLCRYGLSGLVQRVVGGVFPWGTVAVNMVGSFLFGVIWMAATERNLISPQARLIVLTGFMGAFTTFSTFAFESAELLVEKNGLLLGANVLGQVLVGILFVMLGMALGRHL